MEKNKLYLSVSKVQRSALPLGIRIKLHDEMIYWVYIKYRDMEPSLFLNVNNINYLENVHLLAQEIEDFIICDVYNDKEISNDDMFMIPVIALRIAEQYVYGGENAIMWDITDMEDTYQVFPEDEVENEYDKRTNKLYQSAINNLKEMDRKYMEKKKLYLSITMDRIDDLQDQIHDLENKLDDDILTTGSKISLLNKSIDKLENEAFPNDELTARAQIRMTNKRIDQLEQQMGSISNRLIYLNQFVKQYIND